MSTMTLYIIVLNKLNIIFFKGEIIMQSALSGIRPLPAAVLGMAVVSRRTPATR